MHIARSAFLQKAPDTTSVVAGTLSTLKEQLWCFLTELQEFCPCEDGFEKDLAEAKAQEEKDKKAGSCADARFPIPSFWRPTKGWSRPRARKSRPARSSWR